MTQWDEVCSRETINACKTLLLEKTAGKSWNDGNAYKKRLIVTPQRLSALLDLWLKAPGKKMGTLKD